MKKLIIATLAVSVLATSAPVMAAPGHGNGPARHEWQDRRDDRGPKHDRRDDRGFFNVRPKEKHTVVIRKAPAPKHVRYHTWRKGDRFDHRRAPRYVVINNPRHYHLHDAPRGYRWVRSGNDAVLVGIASGVVAAVVTSVLIN